MNFMKIVGTTLNNWNISNSISLGVVMHAWIFVSDRKSLNNSRKYIPKRLIINFWWFLLIVLTYRYRLRYFNHWWTFQRTWCFKKSLGYEEVKKIAQEKIVLLTSHNLKEIEHFCDQTYLLSEKGLSLVTNFDEAEKEIGYMEVFF